jgi:hypothetical protein
MFILTVRSILDSGKQIAFGCIFISKFNFVEKINFPIFSVKMISF